jgi:PEP-CTERM motif
MNRSLLFVVVGSVVVGSASAASAQVIYATGFENPPFAANSQLVGQDGWVGAAGPPSIANNNPLATITNSTAKTGAQSVQVRGSDLTGDVTVTAPYGAVGSYRQPASVDTALSGTPRVRVEADLLLQSTAPLTTNDFFTITLAARTGAGETMGEFGLSSNGHALAYGFDAAPGDPPAFSPTAGLNAWHHIAMDLDFASHRTTYFLDGLNVGSVSAPTLSTVLLRSALVAYALPDVAGGPMRADYVGRFDNFSVTAVPEPNTWVSLLVGGASLLGMNRWARRRPAG